MTKSNSPTNFTIDGLSVKSYGPIDAPIYVLFLHYWGGSSRTWEPTIQSLLSTAAPIRCIAYDHRGWGSSTKPDSDYNAYTIRGLANDCEKIIQSLAQQSQGRGPIKIVLVGHSMGGKVAQLVASRWPKIESASSSSYPSLAGLVLVAPAPPSPIHLPNEIKEQLLHAYDSSESIRMTVEHVLSGSGVEKLGEDKMKLVVEDSLKGGDLSRDTWVNHAMPENIDEEVRLGLGPGSGFRAGKESSSRTLVVGAELDRVEPAEMLKGKVVPKIEGAEFVMLKGVGHLIPLEANEKLAEHITSLISVISA